MIVKRAWARSGEEPAIHVVEPGERVKTAGALNPDVERFIKSLQPDSRYTYVLVNAMGYSEFYGANSNTDWYGYNPHIDHNGLLHAPSDWGQDPEIDAQLGKVWPYGFPSFYGASVYAHHKNSDPVRFGFGEVIFVARNEPMKRIELVERIDNEEIVRKGRQSILDRIHGGERVDVSMGAKIPWDACSICTDWETVNKAWRTFDPEKHLHPGMAVLQYHKKVAPIRGISPTQSEYCDCLRKMRGKILPDGRKVFMYNDFPRFFDISFVWIGADRTARVMWFLPAKQDTASSHLEEVSQQNKLASVPEDLFKESEIQKEVPDAFVERVIDSADQEPDMDPDFLESAASVFGPQALLSTLGSLGIALRPHEFHLSVSVTPESRRVAKACIQRGITFSTDAPGIDDCCAVDTEKVSEVLGSTVSGYAVDRSSFAPYVENRPKTAGQNSFQGIRHPELDKVAAAYNGYRISLLEKSADLFRPDSLPVSWDQELSKTAISGGSMAALLSTPGIVHLISSHLRQKNRAAAEQGRPSDVGAVGNFVARNPTFSSLATVGAGLRAVMGVEKAGGLTSAIKALGRRLVM